jgi:hypothetical protein
MPGNIKGDILVLDIGSLSNDGNPHPSPGPSKVYGASECAGWCNKTAGCNAWTYCKDKANCGSGCNEYTKANPMSKYSALQPAREQQQQAHMCFASEAKLLDFANAAESFAEGIITCCMKNWLEPVLPCPVSTPGYA